MSEVESLEYQLYKARRVLQTLGEQYYGYSELTRPAHLTVDLEEQRKRVTALEALLQEARDKENEPLPVPVKRKRRLFALAAPVIALILLGGGYVLYTMLRPPPAQGVCITPTNAIVTVQVLDDADRQVGVLKPVIPTGLEGGKVVTLQVKVEATGGQAFGSYECAWSDADIAADGRFLHKQGCRVDYQTGTDDVTDAISLQVSQKGCPSMPLYSFFVARGP